MSNQTDGLGGAQVRELLASSGLSPKLRRVVHDALVSSVIERAEELGDHLDVPPAVTSTQDGCGVDTELGSNLAPDLFHDHRRVHKSAIDVEQEGPKHVGRAYGGPPPEAEADNSTCPLIERSLLLAEIRSNCSDLLDEQSQVVFGHKGIQQTDAQCRASAQRDAGQKDVSSALQQ
jgi:hypothetical protein